MKNSGGGISSAKRTVLRTFRVFDRERRLERRGCVVVLWKSMFNSRLENVSLNVSVVEEGIVVDT